ncbi:MAG: hypothetical protein AAFR64_14850, partial [Pseudomonadota bacterium]
VQVVASGVGVGVGVGVGAGVGLGAEAEAGVGLPPPPHAVTALVAINKPTADPDNSPFLILPLPSAIQSCGGSKT